MEWDRGGTTGPSQRQEPLPGRHQGLSRLTGFFPLPKRLAGRISRVPLSGLMLPELPKDKSQEREVQMGLFARLDLGEARLPRPREEADAARNGRPKDERLARPAPRRSASSQPLLPFDRPKPPARAPTGDAEPRAEIPKAQAPRVATPAEPSPPGLPALPPESVATGEVAKARDLLHAIRVLKQVETERRLPDAEERKALTRFGGFGAVALRLFPDPVTGQYKTSSWQALGDELRALLTEEEYASARRTVFNAFYTSPTVVSAMFAAFKRLGVPQDATVLEPGCGAGNFLKLAPAGMHFIGVELDSLSGRIAKALFPSHDIRIESFRDTRLTRRKYRRRHREPAVCRFEIRAQGHAIFAP